MKIASLLFILATTSLFSQEVPAPVPPAAAQVPLNELETKFVADLQNVIFDGRWFSSTDGVLGEAKEDAYKIVGVEKLPDGKWTLRAKMSYGAKEFEIPIPVRVEWAGDTAVIVVKNLPMPGGNVKYSARVLVHEKTYAGTWSGGDQAGLLAGIIRKSK